MKKLLLNLFVLSVLVLTTSCSKDDDNDDGGNAGNATELKVTINGSEKTFNSIVHSYDSEDGGFGNITATINNGTTEIISFSALGTGANAFWNFTYQKDGVSYSSFDSSNFANVVSVNNATSLSATFSGDVVVWNNDTQEYDAITLTNGSVTYTAE